MIRILFFAFAIMFAAPVVAQNVDVSKMTVEQLQKMQQDVAAQMAEKAKQGNSTLETVKELASPENLQTYGQVGKAFAEAVVGAADILGTKASEFASTGLGQVILVGVGIWIFGGTVGVIFKVIIGISLMLFAAWSWKKMFTKRFFSEVRDSDTFKTVDDKGKETVTTKSFVRYENKVRDSGEATFMWFLGLILLLIPGFVIVMSA